MSKCIVCLTREPTVGSVEQGYYCYECSKLKLGKYGCVTCGKWISFIHNGKFNSHCVFCYAERKNVPEPQKHQINRVTNKFSLLDLKKTKIRNHVCTFI